MLGDKAIIGVSADSLEQAVRAKDDGADYIGFGPVFVTNTKSDAGPVSGLDILRKVCHEVSLPIVAIGGIGLANIGSIAASGAGMRGRCIGGRMRPGHDRRNRRSHQRVSAVRRLVDTASKGKEN